MIPLEWLRLSGLPSDIEVSGNLNPIGKGAETHLLHEIDFVQFFREKGAKVSLKGHRIEILLGEGNITSSRQFKVDSQLFLIRLNHPSCNYGVGVSSEQIVLNLKGHFVHFPKQLLSSVFRERISW